MLSLQAVEVKIRYWQFYFYVNRVAIIWLYYRWNQLKIDIEKTGSGDFRYGVWNFHYQNIDLIGDFLKCMFIVKPLIEILIVPDFEEKILQNRVYVISWLN